MASNHCEVPVPIAGLVGVVHLGAARLLQLLEIGEQEDREELFRGVLCIDLVWVAVHCHHLRFQQV